MNDDPKPHSGSRWEPSPDGSDPVAGSDDAARTDSAADPDSQAVTPDPAEPPTEAIPAASEPAAGEPATRRRWRRPVLLAAAAVGLVLGSGLGGFVIGQVTAVGPARIGLVGEAGDYGTHRGGPGGAQRGGGSTSGDGATAPDGTGTQSSGTGADGTSAST